MYDRANQVTRSRIGQHVPPGALLGLARPANLNDYREDVLPSAVGSPPDEAAAVNPRIIVNRSMCNIANKVLGNPDLSLPGPQDLLFTSRAPVDRGTAIYAEWERESQPACVYAFDVFTLNAMLLRLQVDIWREDTSPAKLEYLKATARFLWEGSGCSPDGTRDPDLPSARTHAGYTFEGALRFCDTYRAGAMTAPMSATVAVYGETMVNNLWDPREVTPGARLFLSLVRVPCVNEDRSPDDSDVLIASRAAVTFHLRSLHYQGEVAGTTRRVDVRTPSLCASAGTFLPYQLVPHVLGPGQQLDDDRTLEARVLLHPPDAVTLHVGTVFATGRRSQNTRLRPCPFRPVPLWDARVSGPADALSVIMDPDDGLFARYGRAPLVDDEHAVDAIEVFLHAAETITRPYDLLMLNIIRQGLPGDLGDIWDNVDGIESTYERLGVIDREMCSHPEVTEVSAVTEERPPSGPSKRPIHDVSDAHYTAAKRRRVVTTRDEETEAWRDGRGTKRPREGEVDTRAPEEGGGKRKRKEKLVSSAREEESVPPAREEEIATPAREEEHVTPAREEEPATSAREEEPATPVREEEIVTLAREEEIVTLAREEEPATSARKEEGEGERERGERRAKLSAHDENEFRETMRSMESSLDALLVISRERMNTIGVIDSTARDTVAPFVRKTGYKLSSMMTLFQRQLDVDAMLLVWDRCLDMQTKWMTAVNLVSRGVSMDDVSEAVRVEFDRSAHHLVDKLSRAIDDARYLWISAPPDDAAYRSMMTAKINKWTGQRDAISLYTGTAMPRGARIDATLSDVTTADAAVETSRVGADTHDGKRGDSEVVDEDSHVDMGGVDRESDAITVDPIVSAVPAVAEVSSERDTSAVDESLATTTAAIDAAIATAPSERDITAVDVTLVTAMLTAHTTAVEAVASLRKEAQTSTVGDTLKDVGEAVSKIGAALTTMRAVGTAVLDITEKERERVVSFSTVKDTATRVLSVAVDILNAVKELANVMANAARSAGADHVDILAEQSLAVSKTAQDAIDSARDILAEMTYFLQLYSVASGMEVAVKDATTALRDAVAIAERAAHETGDTHRANAAITDMATRMSLLSTRVDTALGAAKQSVDDVYQVTKSKKTLPDVLAEATRAATAQLATAIEAIRDLVRAVSTNMVDVTSDDISRIARISMAPSVSATSAALAAANLTKAVMTAATTTEAMGGAIALVDDVVYVLNEAMAAITSVLHHAPSVGADALAEARDMTAMLSRLEREVGLVNVKMAQVKDKRKKLEQKEATARRQAEAAAAAQRAKEAAKAAAERKAADAKEAARAAAFESVLERAVNSKMRDVLTAVATVSDAVRLVVDGDNERTLDTLQTVVAAAHGAIEMTRTLLENITGNAGTRPRIEMELMRVDANESKTAEEATAAFTEAVATAAMESVTKVARFVERALSHMLNLVPLDKAWDADQRTAIMDTATTATNMALDAMTLVCTRPVGVDDAAKVAALAEILTTLDVSQTLAYRFADIDAYGKPKFFIGAMSMVLMSGATVYALHLASDATVKYSTARNLVSSIYTVLANVMSMLALVMTTISETAWLAVHDQLTTVERMLSTLATIESLTVIASDITNTLSGEINSENDRKSVSAIHRAGTLIAKKRKKLVKDGTLVTPHIEGDTAHGLLDSVEHVHVDDVADVPEPRVYDDAADDELDGILDGTWSQDTTVDPPTERPAFSDLVDDMD